MNLDSMLTMEQSQLKKTIAKFTKKIAVQIGASKSANTKYIEPKIQHVLDFKTLQNICAVQYLVKLGTVMPTEIKKIYKTRTFKRNKEKN